MEWGRATGLAACGVDWNGDKYTQSHIVWYTYVLNICIPVVSTVSVVSVAAVPELAPCSWPALTPLSQPPAVKGSQHICMYNSTPSR